MKRAFGLGFGLGSLLAGCVSTHTNEVSQAVYQKMDRYVFEAPLSQLRQQVIDTVVAEQAIGDKDPHAASRSFNETRRPLQEYPFIFDGKLREPSGPAGGSVFTVTESNWESRNTIPPYDIVDNSSQRFVFVHRNHLYTGNSLGEKRSELRIYELRRFRRRNENIPTAFSDSPELREITRQVGVVDLDASLNDAVRDFPREWAILERIDPEKASQLYNLEWNQNFKRESRRPGAGNRTGTL